MPGHFIFSQTGPKTRVSLAFITLLLKAINPGGPLFFSLKKVFQKVSECIESRLKPFELDSKLKKEVSVAVETLII